LHYYFRILNEGVTDLIAEEAYREYHKRTGESDVAQFMRGYEGVPHRIVSLLIQKLSERTSVEPDKVWEGFVQGYFAGQNLRDEEIRSLFEETLGLDVVELIKEIKNKEQAEAAIEEIKRVTGGEE
jgi:predicted DsbA family dithiol-disulfide isomerase